ncbi:MAG: histidine phosphatase family protein [Candidatus Nealsonbacteria bacterium]|nr:histidine phosphatase family protein [Candidatus Nealsonbacteria bacterium]
MKNKYFLLRHGQNFYQSEFPDTVYPWPEISLILLTDKGKEEARTAAQKLKNKKIDIIFSSDASRARQTAQIVGKEIGSDIILDSRLRDTNFGVFGNKKKEEYRNFFSQIKEKFIKRPPKGENWNDIEKRVKDFLDEIEEKYKNKNILVVSHGDTLWLMEGLLKNIRDREKLLEIKMQKTGEIREI